MQIGVAVSSRGETKNGIFLEGTNNDEIIIPPNTTHRTLYVDRGKCLQKDNEGKGDYLWLRKQVGKHETKARSQNLGEVQDEGMRSTTHPTGK